MRPSLQDERGSVLVFVTLMIVLLLIMVGMGLDTGQLTYTKSQGQAAVDAAALAAVSALPVSSTEVSQRVAAFNDTNDYVKKTSNSIGGGNITYVQYNELTGTVTDLPSIANANGVRVALESKNPYTEAAVGNAISAPVFLTPLMNIFGGSAPATVNVNVSAVAVLRVTPSVPIAIKQGLCNGSNVVTARLRERGASNTNSCWTTYTDTVSTSNVQDLFDASGQCTGLPANTDRISIGTKVGLSNTTRSGPYFDARTLFSSHNWESQCWIVPVVPNTTNCSGQAEIVDWAKVCPLDVKVTSGGGFGGGGGSSERYISAKVTCSQELFRVEDNLCFSPRLLRDTKSGM